MDSDKFIWAMVALAVALMIIIGGGFLATDYFKKHPDAFQTQPKK
ncbi:hypothetical protein [Neisseria chenwenguii]|nr:hypothetical protein [Neisseria chenwenguii]